jgi:cell division septation protein DedD
MDRKTLLGLITGAAMLGLVLFFGGMLVGAGLFMEPAKTSSTDSQPQQVETLAEAPQASQPLAGDTGQADVSPTSSENADQGTMTPDQPATDSSGDGATDAASGKDPVGDLIAQRSAEAPDVPADTASSGAETAPDAPAAPSDTEKALEAPAIRKDAGQTGDASAASSDPSAKTADAKTATAKDEKAAKGGDATPAKAASQPEKQQKAQPAKTTTNVGDGEKTSPASNKDLPYSVQVGAFKVDKNARQRAEELRKGGLGVAVIERKAKEGEDAWYYVRVGAYSDAKAARSGAEKIKKSTGIDGFPVRTEPNDRKVDG